MEELKTTHIGDFNAHVVATTGVPRLLFELLLSLLPTMPVGEPVSKLITRRMQFADKSTRPIDKQVAISSNALR